jgi:hypothetical protein
MVNVPVRPKPVLAATEYPTVPLPLPGVPDVTARKPELLTAVQGQPAGPVTVIVPDAALPEGLMELGESWKVQAITVKKDAGETPPPGCGFHTVTANLPPVAKSAVVRTMVNCEALTYVVVRGLPFQRPTETPEKKPLPLTVNVNPEVPPSTEVVLRLVIAGTGRKGPGAAFEVGRMGDRFLAKP